MNCASETSIYFIKYCKIFSSHIILTSKILLKLAEYFNDKIFSFFFLYFMLTLSSSSYKTIVIHSVYAAISNDINLSPIIVYPTET